MILGRPANAEIAADLGDRVGTSLATVFVLTVVSSGPGLGHSLIGTRLLIDMQQSKNLSRIGING